MNHLGDAGRGLTPIGNPMTQTVNSLATKSQERLTSKSTDGQPSSSTTGAPSPGTGVAKQTGPGPGTIAFAKSLSSWPNASPSEVDTLVMDSLSQSAKSSLEAVYENRTTAEYGWDQELVRYRLRHDIPAADHADALAILDAACAPASAEVVGREITMLRLMTKSRAETATDLKMMAAAYMQELAKYPADVVIDALRYWTRNEKWWPAWAELRDLLDFRARRRVKMLAALKRGESIIQRNGAGEG